VAHCHIYIYIYVCVCVCVCACVCVCVCVCVNLPDDGTHGVPKLVGESVLSLLCIYSSARIPNCVNFTTFIIRDLKFSCA
jgi:hypothetical protein